MNSTSSTPKRAARFLREESLFTGAYAKGVLDLVWLAYRPWRWRIVLTLLTGLVARFLLLANTNVMGWWADSFCHQGPSCKSPPSLFVGLDSKGFVTILLLLTAVGFILNLLFRISISRVGTYAVAAIYDAVTLRVSKYPIGFFDTTPVGRIITRFGSDYAAMFRMAGGPMGEFLCLVIDLILLLVLPIVASPWFAIPVLLALLSSFLIHRANRLYLRRERRALSRARGLGIAHYSETVQGTRVIRVFGRESVFLRKFQSLVSEFASQTLRTSFAISLFSLQMSLSTALILVIAVTQGLILLHFHLVTMGSVGVAITFVMISSVTVQAFFEWLANLEEALTGCERMHEYLTHPIEPGQQIPQTSTLVNMCAQQPHAWRLFEESSAIHPCITNTNATIKITDLTMRYRPNLPCVLDQINLEIRPGEHLGIIGRTGSGKSSLIQALFHLYPFESGAIHVAGKNPAAPPDSPEGISLTEYRAAFGLIPQDPILFRGTLRENLTRDREIPDTKLEEILLRSGLANLMDLHGKKVLDLHIAERGANLSMGQRQLICLARTLLHDAPIILMDEATSAVDPMSEQLLLQATSQLLSHKTRIVVAHRLATITQCDRVLWLDAGRIRMIGSPDSVISAFQHQN